MTVPQMEVFMSSPEISEQSVLNLSHPLILLQFKSPFLLPRPFYRGPVIQGDPLWLMSS